MPCLIILQCKYTITALYSGIYYILSYTIVYRIPYRTNICEPYLYIAYTITYLIPRFYRCVACRSPSPRATAAEAQRVCRGLGVNNIPDDTKFYKNPRRNVL